MPETESKTEFIHPSFKKKPVYHLDCSYCFKVLCSRGMKAILLADATIEMFSTDHPFPLAVDTVGNSYCTSQCKCKIKDVACTQCGNVIGYHVCVPCRRCMLSSNNGHFWMFNSQAVEGYERLNSAGNEIERWGTLPSIFEEKQRNYSYLSTEECFR